MDDNSEPMDTSSKDLMVSVESTNEWQIHDILYDGTERYLKPLTFQDYVAKLSHKVDWRKLVGGESSQFDPTVDEEIEESEEETAKTSTEPESVGPWETVAKNLHLALTEMNVLLDVIKIAQDRKYMVLDPIDSSGMDQTDSTKLQMGTIFTFKKKVMSQGQKIFENIADRLMRAKQSVVQTKEPDFQTELIELRQAWRLKKLGNTVLGDLCYKNSATKFRPNSTFEVKKSENVAGRLSAIEISLPKDLEQAVCLKITIEPNDGRDAAALMSEVYFHGDKPIFRPGMKLWQQKLVVAQRTLLCRDLYGQLSKEAIHLTDVSCLVRGDCITINFCHGFVMKIKLENIPPSEPPQEIAPNLHKDYRVFVLEHNLFQLFCGDLDNVGAPVVARPVSAPLTSQNKRLRTAGAEALSATVLQAETESDKLLLGRLIEQAKHYTLVSRVRQALTKFAEDCRDPAVWIHWLSETTGVWSAARIFIVTPFYESCNKTLIMLEIGVNSITATTRDGEEIKFSTDLDELINYFWITAKQHLISALGQMSRQASWFTLYCSLTFVDSDGLITPTIMFVNQAGTKCLCVKCPLDGESQVSLQSEMKSREEFLSDFLTNDLWTYIRGSFKLIDYKNLIGRCFLQKMELLLACLS